MTPGEFASHPFSVYRGTHSDDQGGPATHVGTEKAAVEALGAWYHKSSDTAKVHNYWYTPHPDDLKGLVSDQEANLHAGKTHSDYYTNNVEDRGSLSIAVRRPERLRSQAHFVESALKAGKGHEIPKETLDHYHAGTLGVRSVDRAEVGRAVASRPGRPWPGTPEPTPAAPGHFQRIIDHSK